VVNLLLELPQDTWWNLNAFVNGMRENHPDFQRPAGDYDSWFIRREDNGEYLRGFDSWEQVEGALLRFLISGSMHWLGFYDLAAPTPEAAPIAFRPSAWAHDLLDERAPAGMPAENARLQVNNAGLIRMTNLVPRSARYIIARFCDWLEEGEGLYIYRLSPASLESARQQGLRTFHLKTLLRRYCAHPIPPNLLQALERWESAIILRVSTQEVLTALRRTHAARFLGETLSPTTAIIRPGGEDIVRNALAELGYLISSNINV
jgi:hypothetical protein